MKLKITAVCDTGCVRENNEDMILVGNTVIADGSLQTTVELGKGNGIFVAAVADGIGGANAGEIASRIVLEGIRDGFGAIKSGLSDKDLEQTVELICLTLHQNILVEGRANPEKQGMGSTLICFFYYEGRYFYVNAGDSRLYRFRGDLVYQISCDHSLANLTGNKEAASNIIVNSFGGGNNFFIDFAILSKKILNEDIFILCSDGVSDMLNDEELEDIFSGDDFESLLLEASKKKGGVDNISYVLAEVIKESV